MMLEKDITKLIQKYLKSIGAWEYKVFGTAYSRAGVPDLLVCYRGFFVGLEVKRPGAKPTKIQEYEIGTIINAGGIAAVVRSVDDVKKVLQDVPING